MKKSILLASFLAVSSFSVNAAEIKFLCYQDANECDVLEEMSSVWENSTGNTVNFEKVGYDVVRDQLENQLEAGSAPDVARVTNLGGLNQYYLDLTPYVDAGKWETNYGATLPWYRKPSGDNGIYGWQAQLTVTGPYVNVTMFEDAGVYMPEEGATWDDWADALRVVKSELGLTAGLAMDRTAHRCAGPAFSYGAKFHENGVPILVDD